MKAGKRYICSNCGDEFTSWSGKCFSCDQWNTLEEVFADEDSSKQSSNSKQLTPRKITEVIEQNEKRIVLKFGDIDRVLGGGVVPGSVNLLAGEPGIGKSTILLHIANSVAKQNHSVLYISGEESPHQVGLRSKRLGVTTIIDIVSSTSADDIASTISSGSYDVVIVDSIQTLVSSQARTSAGSVSQISASTHTLIRAAKNVNTSVFIVGHVTKEGSIAGPKILEHMVDSVFQLEGDRYGGFKILRSMKNRFGSTNETALFEMNDIGLSPVDNPSKALLSERQNVDGSVVFASIEGTRPLLVEVQALVNTTSFGYPKRTASGYDLNRLNLLSAVLEKRTKLHLSDKDIFINVIGGIRLQEPAADLAVCMAVASAAKGLSLNGDVVVFGEVGLAGDIRHVPFVDQRIKEAKKLGFTTAIGPYQLKKVPSLQSCKNLKTALNTFLSNS